MKFVSAAHLFACNCWCAPHKIASSLHVVHRDTANATPSPASTHRVQRTEAGATASGRGAVGKGSPLRLNVTTSPTWKFMPILLYEFSARAVLSQISEINTSRHASHDLICSGDTASPLQLFGAMFCCLLLVYGGY